MRGLLLFVAFTVLLALPRAVAAQQVSLTEARRLYDAAAYEDALAALSRLEEEESSGIARREAHLLRALSLVALGHEAEARDAMRAVLDVDPQFTLTAAAAAPHVREMFEEVRQQHVMDRLRARYAEARAVYAEGDHSAAAERFDRVRALIDTTRSTLPAVEAEALLELRELAAGFHELSVEHVRSSSQQVAADASPRTEPRSQRAARDTRAKTADSGRAASPTVGTMGRDQAGQRIGTTGASAAAPAFRPPVAIAQHIPGAAGIRGLARGRVYRCAVEVDVDFRGAVTAAKLLEPVNDVYDARLLEAAKRWRFRPATRDGVPVAATHVVVVTLDLK
jgi:TonB family protein